MPRKRFTYNENDVLHTCFRANNKEFLFDNGCNRLVLQHMQKRSARYNVKNYAYVMMDNHMHNIHGMPKKNPDTAYGYMKEEKKELVTLGDMKRDFLSLLAKKMNKLLNRTGCIIQDRSRSIPQSEENQGIVTLLYVFMNPVNAGKVKDPTKYKYSNINMYIKGKSPEYADFEYHPSFMALGKNFEVRRKIFLKLLRWALEKLNIYLPWLSGYFGAGSLKVKEIVIYFRDLKEDIIAAIKSKTIPKFDTS